MLVLWIVIAVVVVAALSATAVTAVTGSRRRRDRHQSAPGAGSVGTAPSATKPRPTEPRPTEPGAPARPARPSEPSETPDEAAEAPAEAPAEVEEEAAEEPVAAPPRFRDRLTKARGLLAGYVGSVRSRQKIDEETWDELEEALLRADVGVATTTAMIDDLRAKVAARTISNPDELVVALREELLEALLFLPDAGAEPADETPADEAPAAGAPSSNGSRTPIERALRFDGAADTTDVWLFVGVNGVGKTTTIGKLARREGRSGRSVLLAAGDTFRAAAGEQLSQWAARSHAEIVKGAEGGDPSAIVFDAVQRAAARGNDLVLADTAGRLHTKVNLVEELKKIRRVADRPPGRVTEVLLVLDATTGQNALTQARQFTDAVAVTGVVLTKLDGTAKGGVVVAIQRELGLPVKLVGLGEGPEDLVVFDPQEFVEALLG